MTALEDLLEDVTAGDPITGLKWTHRSLDRLSRALRRRGIKLGETAIARLMRRKRTVEPYPRAGGRAVPKPTGRLTWPGRPADGDCRVPEPSAPPRGVIQCPRPVPRPRRHWCRARMAGATSPRAMAPARLRLIDQARTRVLRR